MKHMIFLVAAASLVGCAAQQPIIWDKDGGTQAEYDQHARECRYDVAKNTQGTDPGMRTIIGQEFDLAMRQRDLLIMCMEAKGYTRRM